MKNSTFRYGLYVLLALAAAAAYVLGSRALVLFLAVHDQPVGGWPQQVKPTFTDLTTQGVNWGFGYFIGLCILLIIAMVPLAVRTLSTGNN